jgi:uncharacterized protein (DUF58 family)
MFFGQWRLKAQQAVEAAGLLGRVAQRQGHRLGLLALNHQRREIIPPASGQRHSQWVMDRLLGLYREGLNHLFNAGVETSTETPLMGLLQEGIRISRQQPAGLMILSDFIPPEALVTLDFQKASPTWIWLRDPVEDALPPGLWSGGAIGGGCRDPETGAVAPLEGHSPEAYRVAAAAWQRRIEAALMPCGPLVRLYTHESPAPVLLQHFQRGQGRRD